MECPTCHALISEHVRWCDTCKIWVELGGSSKQKGWHVVIPIDAFSVFLTIIAFVILIISGSGPFRIAPSQVILPILLCMLAITCCTVAIILAMRDLKNYPPGEAFMAPLLIALQVPIGAVAFFCLMISFWLI